MKKILPLLAVAAVVVLVLVFALRNQASAPNVSETNQVATDSLTPPEQVNDTEQSDTEAVTTETVAIRDFAYTPATITVKKGSTVTWTNNDAMQHDVMPDAESDDFMGSKLLSKGESYSFTFDTPGTYTYHCSPHTYMKGTVIVTE